MPDYAERLADLKAAIASRGLDGFIIPRADEHLGEYVPPSSERLAFVTGFTGSAGLAIVLRDRAAVWSDGRYVLQLQSQTDATHWERLHIVEAKPEHWLASHASGKRIGYDPWLISAEGLARFSGVEMVPVQPNPVDEIWADRPATPMAPAVPHDVVFAGEDSASKREWLAAMLRSGGQDAAILCDPASLAWLFNIRGTDVPFTPVALGYALVFGNGAAALFMAGRKISPELRAHLGSEVMIGEPAALAAVLARLGGKTVRYDPTAMPVWFKNQLLAAGAKIAEAADPVALPRAAKNAVEQAGARAAHLRDGVAMARFLAWLAMAGPGGAETEMSAAEKLLADRESGENFKGESFPAISGAGGNGAIIHYRVTPESNRRIGPNEVYLIDSGGQYLDGTTDITRTIWTGPDAPPEPVRAHFTRVLAGHIALATAVFPEGVAGAHLDALARAELWQAGLDYDHGTGHGVGAYLSVHEGPAGISRVAKPVSLQPGMILSNEPGFYRQGEYGIRLENLMLVQAADFGAQKRKFLRFETLTLAPFDRALVNAALLTPAALDWLNAYHKRVAGALSEFLKPEERLWLEAATAPIL